MSALTRVGSAKWNDVLDQWRESEANYGDEKGWRERGFKSWDQWRMTHAVPLRLPHLSWTEYVVRRDPREFAGLLWAGDHDGWAQYWPARTQEARFAQIAQHPDLPEDDKVKALLEDFPAETSIMLLHFAVELIVFDGMHRCAALALMRKLNLPVDTQLRVFVADYSVQDKAIFHAFKRLGASRELMGAGIGC